MPLYQGVLPDGRPYKLNGPDGASQQEIEQAAMHHMGGGASPDNDRLAELERRLAALPPAERNSSVLQNIQEGLFKGATGTAESALLGAAAILPEQYETPTRDAIRSGVAALDNAVVGNEGNPEDWSYKLSGGLGSAATFLLPGAIPSKLASLAAVTGLAGTSGVGEASERARAAGATLDERNTAALKGIIPGLTEVVPAGRLVNKLKVPVLNDLVNKLGPKAVKSWKDKVANAAISGGVEGAQEVVQTGLQDLIERGYNPSKEILESAGEDFTIGAFAGTVLDLLLPEKMKGRAPVADKPTPTAEGSPTADPTQPTPSQPAPSQPRQQQNLFPEDRGPITVPAPPNAERRKKEGIEALTEDPTQRDLFDRNQGTMTREEADDIAAFEEDAAAGGLGALLKKNVQRTQNRTRQQGIREDADLTAEIEKLLMQDEAAARQKAEQERVAQEQQTAQAQAAQQEQANLVAASKAESKRLTQEGKQAAAETKPETRRITALKNVIANTTGADANQILSRFNKLVQSRGISKGKTKFTAQEQALVDRALTLQQDGAGQVPQVPLPKAAAQNAPLETAVPEQTPKGTASQPKQIRLNEPLLREVGLNKANRGYWNTLLDKPSNARRTAEALRASIDKLGQSKGKKAPQVRQNLIALSQWLGRDVSDPKQRDLPPPFPSIAAQLEAKAPTQTEATPDAPTGNAAPRPATDGGDVTGTQDREQGDRQQQDTDEGGATAEFTPTDGGGVDTAGQPADVPADGTEQVDGALAPTEEEVAAEIEKATENVKVYGKDGKEDKGLSVTAPTKDEAAPEPEKAATPAPTKPEAKSTTEKPKAKAKAKAEPKKEAKAEPKKEVVKEEDGKLNKYSATENESGEATYAEFQRARESARPVPSIEARLKQFFESAKAKKAPEAVQAYLDKLALFGSFGAVVKTMAYQHVIAPFNTKGTKYKRIKELSEDDVLFNDIMEGTGKKTADEAIAWVRENGSASVKEFLEDSIADQKRMWTTFDANSGTYVPINEGRYYGRPDKDTTGISDTEARQTNVIDYEAVIGAIDAEIRRAANEGRTIDEKLYDKRTELADLHSTLRNLLATRANLKGKSKTDAYRTVSNEIKSVKAKLKTRIDSVTKSLYTASELAAMEATEEDTKTPIDLVVEQNEDARADVEEMTDEDMDALVEMIAADERAERRFLPKEAMVEVETALHPVIQAMMVNGASPKRALEYLSAAAESVQVRKLAERLAQAMPEGVKLKIVDNLNGGKSNGVYMQSDGKKVIMLDAANGMTPHALMHEAIHAITVAELGNPKSKLRKRIAYVFDQIGDRVSTPAIDLAPEAAKLDEFVAEMMSNPHYASQVNELFTSKELRAKPRLESWAQAVWDAIKKFIRAKFGRFVPGDTKTPRDMSATEYFDSLLDQLIRVEQVGNPMVRVALNMPSDAAYAAEPGVTSVAYAESQRRRAEYREAEKGNYMQTLKNGLGGLRAAVKSGAIGATNQIFASRNLADMAHTMGFKAPREMHAMIEQHDAETKRVHEETVTVTQAIEKRLRDGAKKSGYDYDTEYRKWSELINEATLVRKDPTHPQGYYETADGDAQHKVVKDMYKAMPEEFQQAFVDLRNAYKEHFTKLRDAALKKVDEIVGEEGDALEKTKAKNHLQQLFEQATIEPYFPLYRKGDLGLKYTLVEDGEGGMQDVIIERFQTTNQRNIAMEELKRMSADPASGFTVYWGNTSSGKPAHKATSLADDAVFTGKVTSVYGGLAPASLIGQAVGAIRKSVKGTGITVKDDIINAQIEQVTQTLLESLPQASYLRSVMKRTGDRGFQMDPLKAADEKLFQLGRNAVNMQWASRFPEALEKAQTEIDNDPKLSSDILASEFLRGYKDRFNFAMNPPNSWWDRRVRDMNRLNFMMTLGFNLSSPVVNATHLGVVIYPYLAGRYGMRDAAKMIGTATRILASSPTSRMTREAGSTRQVKQNAMMWSMDHYYYVDEKGEFNLRDDIPLDNKKKFYEDLTQKEFLEGLLPFIRDMENSGQFHRSLTLEQAEIKTGADINSKFERLGQFGAFPFHTSEQAVRQITALSLYLSEMKKKDAKQGDAIELAVRETERLNGGALLSTTSRIAQKGVGRLGMMFRSFGVTMYFHQASMAYDAMKALSPEERRIAKRQFWGTQGMVALSAGVTGLTLYGMLRGIHDMFVEDDEPDFDTLVAEHLNDTVMKGGVNYITSVLFGNEGLDVAARIGLVDMIVASGRYNFGDNTDRTMLQNIFGVSYSTFKDKPERALRDWNEGFYQRAFEDISPSAVTNLMKSYRYFNDDNSVLTRRGDVTVAGLTDRQLIAQGLGFAPRDYTRAMERNQELKRIDTAVGTKRTKLLKKYWMATETGDAIRAYEIYEEIIDFNMKWPNVAITKDAINKSIKRHRQTTKDMWNGVLISEKMKPVLYQTRQDLGGPTWGPN